MNKSINKKKIVIIDDEPDIQYTIKEICEYGGWEGIIAKNSKDGYELCKKTNPNLVIVDYHMPDWDGLTTVKKIREFNKVVSILVLTVDERQEIAEKFIAAGASDFALKPIRTPDLISRIKINIMINEMQENYERERKQIFIEKGISKATLDVICNYLSQHEALTIDEITKGVNLAYQTVHRYIQYLIEEGVVEIIPVYGQVGRPKNKYKISTM
ncbi:response regulator [Caloramator sp. E03]|uniref:response regulator n=1 Tax=Caloramator sp. E03 TaxID=2576307 RepID=UPI001FAA6DB1|nr:response regulator [Caloramator sp. E03]